VFSTLHGAFLERKFEMKESMSTLCWDRLGIIKYAKIYQNSIKNIEKKIVSEKKIFWSKIKIFGP
jgi:hypothetical protein